MNNIRVYGLTCVLMMAAAVASATTIVMPSDEQLIAKSPIILAGTVLSTAVVDDDGTLRTESVIAVASVLKSSAPDTITIRELGGELGGRITKLFGTPEFAKGERVLLFVEPSPHGGYRTIDLFIGKLKEGRQLDGRRLWLRDDAGADVILLDANFEPIHATNRQRDAEGFETFVADRVAGRAGRKNYGIENPVLAKESAARGAQENFTMISEPRVYRWAMFDTGGSAAWVSSGTQTGYTGGGVTEMHTGMASWNNYSQAKIRYTYSGVRTGSLGGLSRSNGANEVLFNDPLNEITGSYNASSGGVVGTGGFTGVSGSATWTAPFAADATHPAGAMTAYSITEGNLTIQDGVAPGAGISSSRLAEILAHEFGHTLGFGHSADNTALMYAYVTGLGASLKADDQTAARWLYPNGSVAPPPPPPPPPPPTAPAAPSNLSARASGSSVVLTWNDNATTESGHSIYVAAGSGAFGKVTDVPANSTSATLNGFAAGTYRVYVKAFNSAGASPASNIASVTIAAAAPALTAAFTWAPGNPTTNDTVTFNDQSTGGVSSWYWTFGDGSFATQQNPTKRFSSPGNYSITLAVTRGSETKYLTKTISVSAPAPIVPQVGAAFDVSTASTSTGTNVSFTDRSSGAPTRWNWSFGDGATSTAQNPVHAWAAAGTYTVSLTAMNAQTSSTASKVVTISSNTPYRSLISGVAQQGGIGGTSWRTELSLFNAGTQGANVTVIFLPAAGGTMVTRTLFLGPRQSATYANTLVDLFGIANGAGALAIEATSPGTSAQLRVNSRTFTSGSVGTYGQSVPDVHSDALEGTLYLTGIQSNAAYRTNVGFANRGGTDVGATLTLYDSEGFTISTANVMVPKNNFQQSSLSSFFPEVAGRSYDVLSMKVTTSSQDAVTAYASVINNLSQDPVYLQALPAKSGNSLTIPGVGRAPGLNGTFWRSDVAFFNPTGSRMTLSLRYAGTTKTLSLGARGTWLIADVLTQMGHSSGLGTLDVSWNGGTGPVVTSRTYTTDARGGTYGQSVDPVEAFGAELYVPGLRSDVSYRSNLGFLNGGNETEELTVTLLSPAGFELASTRIVLQPKELSQQAVTALFPHVSASAGSFTLHVRGDANSRLFAFGSMIDNASGDPVFFGGR